MGSAVNKNRRFAVSVKRTGFVLLAAVMFLVSGCSDDNGKTFSRDTTIPDSVSWDINSVLDLATVETEEGEDPYIDPRIAMTFDQGIVHIAYFAPNSDPATVEIHPYCLMYRAFPADDMYYLNTANTTDETVTLLTEDPRNIAEISIAIAGGKPVVAYSAFKQSVIVPGADLNNQGDVMVAVRDGADSWRIEIGAYGYVERNPVFVDGLAQGNLCVRGDDDGNVFLSFQFCYEGVDSYNYEYPDLNFITHPVNAFVNGSVQDMIGREEKVQGNAYQNNASGQQSASGAFNDLVLDADGNPVVFYSHDNSVNGTAQDRGLRVARRVVAENGTVSWPSEYIESGIDVADIKGAVMTDGRLAVVYAVKDLPDFIDTDEELPFVIKYAEQVDVVTGVDENGDDIIQREWHTEFMNYNTICGRFAGFALDSRNRPVAAYFDEMNFTENRFFSRVKVSRRDDGGLWSVDLIVPEDVGLSNITSPQGIEPGLHDTYYIGKYNHLWVDARGRVIVGSYSTVSRKLYLFISR